MNNIFIDYAQQMKNVRAAQLSGDFNKASTLLGPVKPSQTNYTLILLEQARLNFLAKNWSKSLEQFTLAQKHIEEEEQKAKLRVSRGVANVTSLVSSDNALSYDIPAYEQSMLHTYQALNYLLLNQQEGALVEIRKANLVQERALAANQKEIDSQENSFNKKALNQSYPSMEATIGRVKNGFQNAYTFYLSALMYESSQQLEDAYIDYQRALEIYPYNSYIQQDVLRLAVALGRVDDVSKFKELFGNIDITMNQGYGDVVVITERGVINAKDEISLDLPIFSRRNELRFFSFALPVYQGELQQYSPIKITVEEQIYKGEQIARLQSLAAKELQQQLPGLMTRQALRLVAKEQLRRTITKEAGPVGGFLVALYNVASEQADTRSWTTLPDEIQITRMSLPPGNHTVSIKNNGQVSVIDVAVNAKKIAIINFSDMGSNTSYSITTL